MKVLKLFYACLLIGTCMAFTSCDDNEEEASVKKVVGTWSVTEKYYSYKENGTLKEETTDTYQPGECTYTCQRVQRKTNRAGNHRHIH